MKGGLLKIFGVGCNPPSSKSRYAIRAQHCCMPIQQVEEGGAWVWVNKGVVDGWLKNQLDILETEVVHCICDKQNWGNCSFIILNSVSVSGNTGYDALFELMQFPPNLHADASVALRCEN
jgi:hypothetical protein